MSKISTLDWRGEALTMRPVSIEDVPALVSFHRESESNDWPGDDSPVAWFRRGGPWMHKYFCGRHVRAYIDLGWDCWVVERNGETIRGSVEICYAAEPAPFGRYAHLELLELSKDLLDDGIQDWILEQCELRARARGFDKFWCRPVGSGDSWDVLDRRGYVEQWKNSWLTVRGLSSIEPPPFQESRLEGNYDMGASHLLALNHRESASYRWRYLWRPVLTPDKSDFPTDVSFRGNSVAFCGFPPAVVLMNIWKWQDPKSSWADLWVEPSMSADVGYVSDLVSVAGQQALSMGASSMEVVIPETVCQEIVERFAATAVSLERGDPWLMKCLG